MDDIYEFTSELEEYIRNSEIKGIYLYVRNNYTGSLLLRGSKGNRVVLKTSDSSSLIGVTQVQNFIERTDTFKGKPVDTYIYIGTDFRNSAKELPKNKKAIVLVSVNLKTRTFRLFGSFNIEPEIIKIFVGFAKRQRFTLYQDSITVEPVTPNKDKTEEKENVQNLKDFSPIHELHIEKFRHLNNIIVPIGKYITAIAGQNGIGKSSILGLIGHVCREKNGHKTIENREFATDFSEIFRFSYPKYDRPGNHNYTVKYDDGGEIPVRSYERKETNSLRLRVGKSAAGGGKVDCPVIYLGLKRLFPLAQEVTINQKKGNLDASEIRFYQEAHNSILLMHDEEVIPEEVLTQNKSFYGASTSKYDSIGNSAGQDNIGQIITAIISFQRLKKLLDENYKGGVLIIDEVDATMYPAAQIKLIEFLFKSSSDLQLQIIFTTHSLIILTHLLTSKYKHNSKVCYLYKTKGTYKVDVAKEENLPEIISDLNVEALVPDNSKTKIKAYFEDKEGALFFNGIISKENRERIKPVILEKGLGAENYVELIKKGISEFKDNLVVLDGDKKYSHKNIVFLPVPKVPKKFFFFI